MGLEKGVLGISGVREPVGDPDKPAEPVPFGVLEDRRWRLQRDQSRFVAFDTAGTPQDVFKHAVLDVRADAEPGAIDPAAARPPPEHGGPTPQDLAFELYGTDPVGFVKRFMLDLPGGLRTGSKATAYEVRRRHGANIDSIAQLKAHANAARGGKLPPSRPVGATRRPPKPRR